MKSLLSLVDRLAAVATAMTCAVPAATHYECSALPRPVRTRIATSFVTHRAGSNWLPWMLAGWAVGAAVAHGALPTPGELYLWDPTPTSPPTNRSTVSVRRVAGGCQVTFRTPGILEVTSVLGSASWRSVGFESPHVASRTSSPQGFFRSRPAVRPAEVYVPTNYNPSVSMPLVILLHGYTGDRREVEGHIRFRPLAEHYGFLLCAPEGNRHPSGRVWNALWSVPDFNSAVGVQTGDDSAYLRRIIEDCKQSFSVDPKRVYVVGHSMGAVMADRLAADHADAIAAAVCFAGGGHCTPATPDPEGPAWRPSQAVHMLRIHDTADPDVLYAGGSIWDGTPHGPFTDPGAVAWLQLWAAHNGCLEIRAETAPSMDLMRNDGLLDTRVSRYATHPPGGEVELWTLIDGGSHWPDFTEGALSHELSHRAVEWLLAHPKP
jgi:polyhydroxybutyrate depolymerase